MADSDSIIDTLSAKYGAQSPESETPSSPIDTLEQKYGAADTSPVRGTLAEVGRQVGAGAVVDLPEMTGKAIQALSPTDSGVNRFGKEMRENAEARAPGWEPDLRDKGEVAQAAIRAGRAIPASVAPIALSAVPVVGPELSLAATGALFGGSQYQDTYEKLISEGASPEEAKEAALGTAATQGGGEMIANKLTAGVLGAGKNVAANTIGGLTGQLTEKAALKTAAKDFGKAYAADLVGEPATEIAQDTATEAIERAYGANPSTGYGDIAYQSGTTALAMAALLGLPGAGGHYANHKRAELIDQTLNDPASPESARLAAVNGIYNRAQSQGIQDADEWRAGALEDIAAGRPIRRDTASIPAAAVAQQQAEQSAAPVVPEPNAPQSVPETIAPAPVPEQAAAPIVPEQAVTPEAPAPAEPDLNAVKNFVSAQEARWANTPDRPRGTNPAMRNVATDLGLDPKAFTSAEDLMGAIKQRVSDIETPAPKTPGQQVAEDIAGKGTISDMLAGHPEILDTDMSMQQAAAQAEEQAAAAGAHPEQVERAAGEEQAPVYVDATTGEILDGAISEENAYSPEKIAALDDATLSALSKNLSGQRLAAVQQELLRRKAAGGENAEQIPGAGQNDVGGGAQSEVRGEGGDTPVGGPGVPPSRQESGNIQQEQSETPIPQEVTENGKSENPTTQETAAQEEIAAGDYAPAATLSEAANATEAAKADTPEQDIQNGDYTKGVSAEYAGLPIAIENAAGSQRTGTSPDGRQWSQTMRDHYGEIVGAEGADGDHVDVFVNPNGAVTKTAFVIDQVDPNTGLFDEHKVVLGYPNKTAAAQAYLSNYEEGWKGLGSITGMTLPNFKKWLATQDTTKPVTSTAKVKTENHVAAAAEPKESGEGQRLESARQALISAVPDGNLEMLFGAKLGKTRQQLMRILTGDPKWPANKSGMSWLRDTFYKMAGIPDGYAAAVRQDAFKSWAKGQSDSTEPPTPLPESAPRAATSVADNSRALETIFAKIDTTHPNPAELREMLKDNPFKEQITYVVDHGFEIFQDLLKSDKNPNGKVERVCP